MPASKVQDLTFEAFLTVSANAARPAVLVRCEMLLEGDFTPQVLRLLRFGLVYSTWLKSQLPAEAPELRFDIGYILKELPNGAILLGIVRAHEDDQ